MEWIIKWAGSLLQAYRMNATKNQNGKPENKHKSNKTTVWMKARLGERRFSLKNGQMAI